MTDEVLPRRLPHDPNSFGAGLMRSAIEQGFPSVGGNVCPALPRPVTTYDLFAILVELGVGEGYEDADWRAVAIRRVRNRIRKRILEADPSSANTPLMATEPPRVNEFSGPPFERAPAWTREAPTSDGLFWIRFDGESGGDTVAYWVSSFEGDAETLSFDGAEWTLAYARELYPDFEWWPVRLEPPES